MGEMNQKDEKLLPNRLEVAGIVREGWPYLDREQQDLLVEAFFGLMKLEELEEEAKKLGVERYLVLVLFARVDKKGNGV